MTIHTSILTLANFLQLFGVALTVAVVYGLYALYGALTTQRTVPTIPLIDGEGGLEKGKRRYIANSREVIASALRQANGAIVQIYADGGPKILLKPEHIHEIKNDPNFCFDENNKNEFLTQTAGFKKFALGKDGTEIFKKMIRVDLTQALSQLTVALSEEAALTMDKHFAPSKEWTQTPPLYGILVDLVSQLSARVFLGLPLCRNPEWIRVSGQYAIDYFESVPAVRRYPPFLRPLVFHLLPQVKKLKKTREAAYQIIDAELRHRHKERDQRRCGDETLEKEINALQWFEDAAAAAGRAGELNIVNGLLALTMVAVHTTSNTLTNVLLDLAVRPDLVDELRREIVEVLGTPAPKIATDNNNDSERDIAKPVANWQKTSLYRLQLLDSVLKESQRLNPVSVLSLRRTTLRAVTLSDGTRIPSGASVGIPTSYMQNPNYLPHGSSSPLEDFDGHRFLRMRETPGEENRWQFVTTSAEHFAFGAGIHSCPGRFFVSNELKIVLVHAVSKYDWRIAGESGKRPENILRADQIMADPEARLEYISREPEIIL